MRALPRPLSKGGAFLGRGPPDAAAPDGRVAPSSALPSLRQELPPRREQPPSRELPLTDGIPSPGAAQARAEGAWLGVSMSETVTVTTWYLEQTSPDDLVPAQVPDRAAVEVSLARVASPEFSRFLYASVGQDIAWTDRLPWTYARWREFLDRPAVETWVAYEHGTPAGFIELDGTTEGVTEISYFGLLPAFRGRGIGGHLLSYGTSRAWDLAGRWPGRATVGRVWVHTCTKDGEHARANYEKRGFRLYRTETEQEPCPVQPGPWPGA